MAGRGAKTPTKNSSNIPLHTPPVKHEKIPQLSCYQTYMSQVPAFATFFPGPSLLEGGACHVNTFIEKMNHNDSKAIRTRKHLVGKRTLKKS